jgi:hypothetical protein
VPKVLQQYNFAVKYWEHNHASRTAGRQRSDVSAKRPVGTPNRITDHDYVGIFIYDSSMAPLRRPTFADKTGFFFLLCFLHLRIIKDDLK